MTFLFGFFILKVRNLITNLWIHSNTFEGMVGHEKVVNENCQREIVSGRFVGEKERWKVISDQGGGT